MGWLRRQAGVRSAALGRDRQTIDIHFQDGQEMLIVPRSLSTRAVPAVPAVPAAVAHALPAQTSGARALVLEPFASILGLGAAGGQVERDDLGKAGFSVTELDDTSVTVDVMSTLSQYNVVYMHTHSGTTTSGEGVLVTGQLATSNPCPSGLPEQCPVIVSGVYGNPQLFYAVTSLYVQQSMGTFAKNSILFFNGCAFLPATRFWNALSSKGVGVMVSWDNDTLAYDDFLNGAAFFNQMAAGATVSSAISTMKAAGYGTSVWNGVTSHLGFLGNGNITLAQARQGQAASPTATPQPTDTPTVTPRPTQPSTSVPTATSTPMPTDVPPSISLAHATVKPGAPQVVTVRTNPGRNVTLQVRFPHGAPLNLIAPTDASGTATFTFTQPANSVGHTSRTAHVQAQWSSTATGKSPTLAATYTIGYGKIDLSSSKIMANRTQIVTVWVHTHAGSTVKGAVQPPGGKATRFTVRTGKKGWASYKYQLKKLLVAGQTVSIRASVILKGHVYKTALGAIVT